jgi:preprotein translocase subunit SecB
MPITNMQLKHYFFTIVNVEANVSFASSENDESGIDIQKKVSFSGNNENKKLIHIALEIKIVPQMGKQIPYNVNLTAIGIFEVTTEGATPDKENLVLMQGATILYNASREFLLGVMYRGPWSPILLPITLFSTEDIEITN